MADVAASCAEANRQGALMRRHIVAVLLAATVLAACEPQTAVSSSSRTIPQGDGYDFFVLSLSWSPSYCEIEGAGANRQQCGRANKHGFVVHGLWPQFERGWPEFCNSSEPARVPESIVRTVIDLMPSAGLVGHQWRKHGSCTGLSQEDYFSVVRRAREKIAIPERFKDVEDNVTISPNEAEKAFISVNPGMSDDGIAISCQDQFLSEARICLTKQLEFRSCPEIDTKGCRIPRAALPPGG
jgi:ribonuclease T2